MGWCNAGLAVSSLARQLQVEAATEPGFRSPERFVPAYVCAVQSKPGLHLAVAGMRGCHSRLIGVQFTAIQSKALQGSPLIRNSAFPSRSSKGRLKLQNYTEFRCVPKVNVLIWGLSSHEVGETLLDAAILIGAAS